MRRFLARSSAHWHELFHAQCDTRVLALLRIGFATLVLLYWLAMLPYVEMLWSNRGMLPLSELYSVAQGFVPTLFSVLPHGDLTLWVGYVALALHASLLLVGYRSRLQIILLLVWLVSLQNRNPLVLNGQDALLRMIGVFLAFAPLGTSLSVDAWLDRATARQASAPYFPLRFVQFQVAIVMLAAGIWKLRGEDWTNGDALYYVTRLAGFWDNLPLPAAVQSSAACARGATFATLTIELCVPILIWIPRTRRLALATALLFHVALAYAMNLFLFQPIMMLGWCSFLRREDLDWLVRVVKRRSGAVKVALVSGEGELT